MMDNSSDIPLIERKFLDLVPLEDLAQVLNKSLKDNFAYVNVEVVDCPDLTKQPFTLANPGLSGDTKLVEIGGVAYLRPFIRKDKIYDLKKIANCVNSNPAFIIGAGGGPSSQAGVNWEVIFNLSIEDGVVDQQSRGSRIDQNNEAVPIQEILPNTETRVAVLGNLFFSNGKPGKVLKIHTKKRTGSSNFVTSIRQSLVDAYPNKVVALGGTFLLKEGQAKHHVVDVSVQENGDLTCVLKFFNMSAPLINVGTLINNDYDLDLDEKHFHSFSHHGEAGHYYIDTTPDSVEYLGYFNTAAEVCRVDRPPKH